MSAFYLYANALLYAGFAIWCTVAAASTSAAIGYGSLTSSGESEFRVVYGGLQLGLAAVFAYLAGRSELWRLGIGFAVALYAPVVLYRLVTVARFWPVSNVTLALAVLEILLFAWALLLAAAATA